MHTPMTERYHPDWWDKFWKSDNGHGDYVIFQMPNVWLIGWAVMTLLSLFTVGTTSSAFSWIATGLLAIWSLLEIIKGDSFFRRLLGIVIMLFVVANFIAGLH